jgi:hypothetical protein
MPATTPDENTEPLVGAVVESIIEQSGRHSGEYLVTVRISVTPEGMIYTWEWFSRANQYTKPKGTEPQ